MRRLNLILILMALLSLLALNIASTRAGSEGYHPLLWGNFTGWSADNGPMTFWMSAGDRYGGIWIKGSSKGWGKPWLQYGYCSSGYGAIDQWLNPNDYAGAERVEEADIYHTVWNLTTTGHPAAYIYSLQTAWYGYPWMKVEASYRFKAAYTLEVRYMLSAHGAQMYNFTVPKASGYYGGTPSQIGYGGQKVYDNSTESLIDNWVIAFDEGLNYFFIVALVRDPEAIIMGEYGGSWVNIVVSYGSTNGVPGQFVKLPPVYMGFYNRTHDKGAPFSSYQEMYQMASRLAHAMICEPRWSDFEEHIVEVGKDLVTIERTLNFTLMPCDWGDIHQPITPSCPWAENVEGEALFTYEGIYLSHFSYVSGFTIRYQLLNPRLRFPAYGRPLAASDKRFERLLNHTLTFVDGLKYHGLFWAGYWAPFFSRVGFTLDAMDDAYADTYWTMWISIQTTEADPHLQSWQSPIPAYLRPLVNHTWWRGYIYNETTGRWEMSEAFEAGWEMWSTDYMPRIIWGLYYHYLVSQNETYKALMTPSVLRALETLREYTWVNPDLEGWYSVGYDVQTGKWSCGIHRGAVGLESAADSMLAYYSGYLLTGDEDYLIRALKVHAENFKFLTEYTGYPGFMGSLTVARIMPRAYRAEDLLHYGIENTEYRRIRPGCVADGTYSYDEIRTPANTYYSACSLMALMALGDVENATRFWRFLADAQEITENAGGPTGGICDTWNASTNTPIWGLCAVDTAAWTLGGLSYTLNTTLSGDTLYFRVNIPANWTRFRGYSRGEGQLIEYELRGEDEHLIFQVSEIATIRYRVRQPERAIIRVKKDGRTIYNWRVEDGELIIPGLTGTTVEVFVIDPHPYIVKLYMALMGLASASTSLIAALRRKLGGRSILILLAILTLTLILTVAGRWVVSLFLQGVAI